MNLSKIRLLLFFSITCIFAFSSLFFPQGANAQFNGNLGRLSGTIQWGTQATTMSQQYQISFTGNSTHYVTSIQTDGSYDTGFNLPPDTYTISVTGTSFGNFGINQTVTVGENQSVTANIDLSGTTGLVKGNLKINGSTSGGFVQFCSASSDATCPSPIDTSGDAGPWTSFPTSGFNVALLPGNYRAHVTTSNGVDAGIIPITVTAGQVNNDSSLQVQLNLGRITGSVLWGTQATTMSQQYQISFTGNTTHYITSLSTQKAFDTGFTLPPDTYTVSVTGTSFGNFGVNQTVTVTAGQTIAANIDLSGTTGLVQASMKVNGTASGGFVQFCASGSDASCPTPIDTSGDTGPWTSFTASGFNVAILPGNYRVHVTTTDGKDAGIIPITVTAGQVTNDPSIQFQLNLGKISGTILWGAQTTTMSQQYHIFFTGNTTQYNTSLQAVSSYNTGFTMPPDTYTISVTGTSFGNFGVNQTVTVGAGQAVTANIDLSTTTGLVKGNMKLNGTASGGFIQFCDVSPDTSCPSPIDGSGAAGPWTSFPTSGFNVALLPGNYQAHVTTTSGVSIGIIPITVVKGQILNLTYSNLTPTPTPTPTATPTPTSVPAFTLSGKVYIDANQNGVQDSGEAGYANATVSLDSGQSTTTDSNGNYTFSNVEAGSYVDTLTVPSGYNATTTNPATVALAANTTQNFGIATATSLVTAINAGGDTQGSYVSDIDSSGGSTYSSGASVDTTGVTNPASQAVYQTVRYGNFSYTIPNLIPNGTYTVRLHFNEVYWGTDGSDATGKRVFNVAVNGTTALTNYDIFQAAGGANKAVVEQVPATADSNGNITIQFSTVVDNAMINGIELYSGSLPSPTPTPTPTPVISEAINSGGNTSSDFVADAHYFGGTGFSSNASVDTSGVTNPAPQAIYQSVRYGNFSYTIPTYAPSTSYHVRLHFNEIYWNSAGSRTFNVAINGQQVLNNFDIFDTAGGENKAIVKEFNTTSDTNGRINIQFTTVTDNAMINGIEISKN